MSAEVAEQVAEDCVQALLDDVAAADQAARAAADRLRAAVQTASAGGASWRQIGQRLGVTRQSAHVRFRSRQDGVL